MSSKSFSFSEVLSFGWGVMKANFWFFAGVFVVLLLISLLGQIPAAIMEHYPKAITPFWFFVMLGVTFIVQIITGIGLIKIALGFCDGQKPRFGTLFNGFDCFWRYIGTGLLYGLIVSASIVFVLPFILLSTVMRNPCVILPALVGFLVLAVILSIKFGLCFYFVIDKGLGPINALRASSRATMGAKGSLFIFGILCGLINLLGALCFLVGLFATIPTVIAAMAVVYRQLSEQTPELAELGISSPGIEPASGVRFSKDIRPAPDTQREKENNKSFFFWLGVLVILGIAIAAGVTYRLWPKSTGKATVFSKDVVISPNDVAVSSKDVVVSSKKAELKGILYSEDNPSASVNGKIVKEGSVIDGIKVVKINKDSVEFEKNGEKWTQRLK